jgi:hypothetical protein
MQKSQRRAGALPDPRRSKHLSGSVVAESDLCLLSVARACGSGGGYAFARRSVEFRRESCGA